MLQHGQLGGLHGMALALQPVDGGLQVCHHLGVRAGALQAFAVVGDAQLAGVGVQRGGLHGAVAAGVVQRVVAGHGLVHPGGIVHVVREGPDLVEAAGEGDEAVAAHAAVGGLEADRAGEGGRLPDGTARVRSQGRMHDLGSHTGRCPT